jgi:hypothetical protein
MNYHLPLPRTRYFIIISLVITSNIFAQGWLQDFESGKPLFGFTGIDRGSDYGLTEQFEQTIDNAGLNNTTSVYLNQSWDGASRELGITDGIITLWFKDGGYNGPNSNSIRLRSEEDNENLTGWPANFLTVDLKGKRSGHGGGLINTYYVCNPTDANAMGTHFGVDIASSEKIPRVTQSWNQVSFVLDNGIATASINGSFADNQVITPLTRLELLCRSGWYLTRGGDAQIMQWDDIIVMPKIYSTTMDAIPDWLTALPGTDIEFNDTPSGGFTPLPQTGMVSRFTRSDMGLSMPWNVEQGSIEIWFWDPYYETGRYKNVVALYNANNSDEYLRIQMYSILMNKVSTNYYAATHLTGHGQSHETPRSQGWHRIIFSKTNNKLTVSVDGNPAHEETNVWHDAPNNLVLKIQSGDSNYSDGGSVWFSRMMVAGIKTTPVNDWSIY